MPRSRRNIQRLLRPSSRGRATSAATTAAEDETDLSVRFGAALERLGYTGGPAALAVSGGGDSVALLNLFARWFAAKRVSRRKRPPVLIVDHGLRPASKAEAEEVARWTEQAGFAPHRLSWRGEKPQSNLEEAARLARYRLLGDWCLAHTIPALFLAHTMDDQAETFLLRLGRGSGLDGLSGMRPRAPYPLPGYGEIALLRPLLEFGRSELRNYLRRHRVPWLEDPMNADPRFARTRIRAVLPTLEAAGVPVARIAAAAAHLSRAREALEAATEDFLARHARFEARLGLLDGAALARVPREVGLRALRRALMDVAGTDLRPRFERLEPLFDRLISGTRAPASTLLGCRVGMAPKARQAFGPATIVLTPEKPRKT